MNFVRKILPYHLSENVATDQQLDIYFFLDLNKGAILPENIILFNLTEEKSESIKYNYANKHLVVNSVKPMSPNTHYQIQLIGGKSGLKDITGQQMEETYVSEFYTKSVKTIQPPILTSPTDLIEIKDDIQFEWKPAIDAKYYELQISKSNTFHNLVWPKADTSIYENHVSPHIYYESGTYYARIRSVGHDGEKSHYSKMIRYHYNGVNQKEHSNVKEVEENSNVIIETSSHAKEEGSPIESLQNHFVNECREVQQETLSIIDSHPKHKALNLSSNPNKITITFDKNIDENTVSSQSIYIIEERN